MKRITLLFAIVVCFNLTTKAQEKLDELLPVRGLCISAPQKEGLDEFIKFIKDELIPKKANTLVLRVDWNYAYESHPELRDEDPLTAADVKKIVQACREGGIQVIPQINLLGHQSWHGKVYALLTEYPQFNETPDVVMPAEGEYEWPNPDGLYCLSYCPLHPDVHKIVFELVDEIVEVFESKAFHAGMDEVFYIGHEQCPRCHGRDKAELFAGEVTKIRDHLMENDKELWIWGDRLIDGKTTGIGVWSASMNNTHRAIDMIPKDVVINDWHYNRPNPTAALFALKGFRVISCPYRKAEVAKIQMHMMMGFRENATPEIKENYQGMMQTIWTSAENFLDYYYGRKQFDTESGSGNYVECFNALFEEIDKLDK